MHRKQRQARKRRLFALVVMVTALAFGGGCYATWAEIARGEREIALLQEERAALLDEAEFMREEIAYAKTSAYVERMARDQLGMIRPGEITYRSR